VDGASSGFGRGVVKSGGEVDVASPTVLHSTDQDTNCLTGECSINMLASAHTLTTLFSLAPPVHLGVSSQYVGAKHSLGHHCRVPEILSRLTCVNLDQIGDFIIITVLNTDGSPKWKLLTLTMVLRLSKAFTRVLVIIYSVILINNRSTL